MTTLQDRPAPAADRPTRPVPVSTVPRPRALTKRTADDVQCLVGSFVASLLLVWLAYTQLMPGRGKLGFVILWFLAFTVLYGALTSVSNPRPVVVSRVMSTIIQGGALIVGTALASVLIYTFYQGHEALFHLNLFTKDQSGAGPLSPLNKGGILHAIVGSLIEIGIAVAFALPLGIGTAVFMTEIGGSFARIVRTVVEAMTALPSIVAGLFIYSTLIVKFGVPKSGIAAACALFVMILPIIARSADVVLRVVPDGLRQAGLALGAPTWRVVWSVVLPTARSGLATALILGIARGVGETSPVLFTSGASSYFNSNPLSQPMNSLPLYIFNNVRNTQKVAVERGFGAASVLLGVVMILFVITRVIARKRPQR